MDNGASRSGFGAGGLRATVLHLSLCLLDHNSAASITAALCLFLEPSPSPSPSAAAAGPGLMQDFDYAHAAETTGCAKDSRVHTELQVYSKAPMTSSHRAQTDPQRCKLANTSEMKCGYLWTEHRTQENFLLNFGPQLPQFWTADGHVGRRSQ